MFHVCVRTSINGSLHLCRGYATLDLARWWAISWLKNGYFPLSNHEGVEAFVPSTSVDVVVITESP